MIKTAVAERKNILIAGGTGTGKTTLANAVLNEISAISPDHRIVIIEDVLELQCSVKNTVFLRTSANIDQVSLLRATLRLRPDRIVVGEVRDKSALALLKAWNTGHPGGIGTVHANSTGAALVRVGQLIQEAGVPAAPELISEAVNLVISIRRNSTGRQD
jgi:Flp pilus assembly CpaF family ATPase